MKTNCYTMDRPGIGIRDGKIVLGQEGRGRKQVIVSVANPLEIADRVDETWVFSRGGYWVEPRDQYKLSPEVIASAEKQAHWNGKLLSLDSQFDGTVIVRIPDQSGFRGSWSYELSAGVAKLAEGCSAQGDAGRMGGGPDILVRMTEGSAVEIKRSGRLYGKSSRITLAIAGGAPVLDYHEETVAAI